jgi:hypothetical protein
MAIFVTEGPEAFLAIGRVAKSLLRRPQNELASRINKRFCGQTFLLEHARMTLIRRKKEVVWSAVLDLGIKGSRGGERRSHSNGCLLFKDTRQVLKREDEIRRYPDGQLLLCEKQGRAEEHEADPNSENG